MAVVYIPSLMQNVTDGNKTVEVEGSTVRQIVESLARLYPGLKERLVEDNQIKVAVDGEVGTMGMLEKVGDNSEVHFLPAIGGGARYA